MSNLRASHVALLLIGLVSCGVILAISFSKIGHIGLLPRPITTAPHHHTVGRRYTVAHSRVSRPGSDSRRGGSWSFGEFLLVVGLSLLGSLLAAAGLLVYIVRRRLASRVRRDYGLFEVRLSMHDQARREDLVAMVEALGNAVRAFPERRTWDGQPFIAFEAHYGPGPGGELEWVLCVRCERALAQTVDAMLASAYPDARLGYEFAGPPRPIGGILGVPGHVLRFRKERTFVQPICEADPRAAGSSPMEAIAQAQVAAGTPSTVRVQLTPTMLAVERWARQRLRAHETSLAGGDTPSTGVLVRTEITAASHAQNQAWFWAEIQVAAQTREHANRIAAAVQARRGPNRLHRRWMITREDLYRRRFPTAYPPVLPAASLRSLLSSVEIAHLIELPGARLKAVPVRRLALPRIPAPPEVWLLPDDPQPELPADPPSAAGGSA
jgi:hypothetical protein